jgi:hypothetical protein
MSKCLTTLSTNILTKIPKGYHAEAINRRTDNTMAKLKRTHNDLQNTIQNTKDQATRLQLSDDRRYIHVRRYQRGNQNLYLEEGQTTQWSKEKGQTTNNNLQNIHIKLKIE